MTLLRPLSSAEIAQLSAQGCTAVSWAGVKVRSNFPAERVCRVHFSGEVELGHFEKEIKLPGGVIRHSGVYNSTLHNVSVGDDTLIEEAYIANYQIGNEVVIRKVSELVVNSASAFGNGLTVDVLSETGGRSVRIYDHLSSSMAYCLAMYRHRPALISRFETLISEYTKSVTSDRGSIGSYSQLLNCGSICQVRVGEGAVLRDVIRLENGTVNSTLSLPAKVGAGVQASGFIISSGAKVESGALLHRVFVGQGVHLAKQFSATDSLFFSYSQGEHGEACAVFAAPFTITHHKPTLLIAGYFSFLNAGSGSNQSNHLYRLGPLHHGFLERGCKLASDSYLLWPARVGAFSLISGRHLSHADTSVFPFSYLVNKGTDSLLLPGANIFNIGLYRDARKWETRDILPADNRLDFVRINLFSPYSFQKIVAAIGLLNEIKQKQTPTSDGYLYKGVTIPVKALQKGVGFYRCALFYYLGDLFLQRLSKDDFDSLRQLKELLRAKSDDGKGAWIDWAGFLAEQPMADSVLSAVEAGEIDSLSAFSGAMANLHNAFHDLEWNWAINQIEIFLEKKVYIWSANDIVSLLGLFAKSADDYFNALLEDAKREFSPEFRVTAGVDGDSLVTESDFSAVRSDYDKHPVVLELHKRVVLNRIIISKLTDKIEQI